MEIAKFSKLEAGPTLTSRDTLRARHGVDNLRGDSDLMQQVRHNITLFARSNASVLIEGDTGTGKELAAQAIHQSSGRARAPFVAVNCGAIAESLLEAELFGYQDSAFTGARRGGHAGLIETAHRGTLFLDEIGEMPLPLQTRLLRVLEERQVVRVGATRPIPVDVRIISATHCNLKEKIDQSQFRRDLYYRLAVLQLQLPTLRSRVDDVINLTEWCLKNAMASLGIKPHANMHAEVLACQNLLKGYAWPGNVRELRNVCERLALFLLAEPLQALTPALLMQAMPELQQESGNQFNAIPLNTAMRSLDGNDMATITKQQYHAVLHRFKGNRIAAAAHLGISRTTLWRKLKE
jgi:propionate catabolism operon transcriptional regulator